MSIGKKPCPSCNGPLRRGSKQCWKCHNSGLIANVVQPEKSVTEDRERRRILAEQLSLKARYKEALDTIERQDSQLRAMNVLEQGLNTFTIAPKKGSHTSEGTVVMVASDWHMEERVGAEVGGLNTYSLDIAHQRAERFFQSGLRLVQLLQQDLTISSIVLALLGDFISNDIHEEFTDVNDLQPVHALVYAQSHLISGIQFLLDHFDGQIVLPCHSGNHARTTRTTRFSAENGHSLEYLMYLHLANHFRHESRVQFIVPEGMHSYMQVYDTTVRFQHGHAIKYGGGVGGIFIPTFKAIAQWNKGRHADLDVFGHFHQSKDGGNFVCNGSLIGYSAFALSIKADFEPPRQTLFLIDKKRGRTCTWPIIVDK